MSRIGYRVLTSRNGKETLQAIKGDPFPELIIIDPNFPDVDDWNILHNIEHLAPAIPVIVHTYISDYSKHTMALGSLIFVEKRGNSIDSLKKIATEVLQSGSKHG